MAYIPQPGVPMGGWCEEKIIYQPRVRPGFVAWATAFSYGDGTYGVSFDEVTAEEDPAFTPSRLEYAEAAGVPVSYGAVEAGSAHQCTRRVYLRTSDGRTFTETGRCLRGEGSLCAAGFPDGRILGFDVPRRNAQGTGWCDYLRVRESADGGATWRDVCRLLEGCAPYLWRVRRLNSGEIIVLASLYGTPWGPGRERATRNTMLPGESYESKIQTFFLTTRDGREYSGPHYILPGIGAHEFDVAELPDGRLLFIAGDVQGTPVGRQIVSRSGSGWVNGTLLPIRDGAPPDPAADPQGGFVPETLVWDDAQGCLVGYRRNRCFSVSNDLGEHWTPLEPPAALEPLYQPVLIELGGALALFGHVGGDVSFGQTDTHITVQLLRSDAAKRLPRPAHLTLERCLAPDGSHYENRLCARLTAGDAPLAGQEVEFRFDRFWNPDGSVNKRPLSESPMRVRVRTDEDGLAFAHAGWFDGIADIHLAYNADVVCPGSDDVRACEGPSMTLLALTPARDDEYPYDAYFANGTLYLSPAFRRDFPRAEEILAQSIGQDEVPAALLGDEAVRRLAASGVLCEENGKTMWIATVHAPRRLDGVRPMASGDRYI